MSSNKLNQFTGQKYISLQTFRKNGAGVATPVWFAADGETLYVYSLANAGKVKRIRNNPRVKVTSCDIRGNTHGEWVEARARLLDGAEAAQAHRLLDKKYGLMKKIGGLFSRLMKRQRMAIAIELGNHRLNEDG